MKEDQAKDAGGNLIQTPVDPFLKKEREEQSMVLHTGYYKFSGVDKPKNPTDVYALKYAEFVVPLVKEMQEQQKEIQTLKEKIDSLEKLLQQLMSRK